MWLVIENCLCELLFTGGHWPHRVFGAVPLPLLGSARMRGTRHVHGFAAPPYCLRRLSFLCLALSAWGGKGGKFMILYLHPTASNSCQHLCVALVFSGFFLIFVYFIFIFNYIILTMLLPLSWFFLLWSPSTQQPTPSGLHHCSCPWVMLVSSLLHFLDCTLHPRGYFVTTYLYFVIPSPLHPFPHTPASGSHQNTLYPWFYLCSSFLLSLLFRFSCW